MIQSVYIALIQSRPLNIWDWIKKIIIISDAWKHVTEKRYMHYVIITYHGSNRSYLLQTFVKLDVIKE